MSTKKINRKPQDKAKKGRLTEKSMSFHGHDNEELVGNKLRRPRTVPDLLANASSFSTSTEVTLRPKLTKLLLNVTVQRSLGPLHILISPESSVGDLIADSLRMYSKEGRRPILSSLDPSSYGLHYSQFSLECLETDEKLIELGSRSFFLCPKQRVVLAKSGHDDLGQESQLGCAGRMMSSTQSSSTCSKEVEKVGWLRFMNF
uniref:uncharacterized protein At4g22758-like n=1 Tax=Erigeron canadensis TaxID=72917 RepID=UPI001CB8C26A|nr:uncharacterized protein At4g22758-like [Erigeron canadensis]